MKRFKFFLLILTVLTLAWSSIAPMDRLTWLMETLPVWIGLPLLVFADRRWKVTPLLYTLVCIHCVILCIGAQYTYAEVPIGFWVRDMMGWSRNPYDRLGHFFQGFMPIILAREVFIRQKAVREGFWMFVTGVGVCLAFSAFYEIIEWGAAIGMGESAEAFLSMQGDVWDTQWDMFLALCGALAGWFLFSSWHTHQVRSVNTLYKRWS